MTKYYVPRVMLGICLAVGFLADANAARSADAGSFCKHAVSIAFDLSESDAFLSRENSATTVFRGHTAFFYAAITGRLGSIRTWLGFPENKKLVDAELVFVAIQNEALGTIRLLLQEGINIALTDERGTTTTTVAAQCGNAAILAELVNARVVSFEPNYDGVDPMIAAIMADCLPCVELLLDAGYNVKQRHTKNGKSLRELALAKGNSAIASRIERAEFFQGRTTPTP